MLLGCALVLATVARGADEAAVVSKDEAAKVIAQLEGVVVERPAGGWMQMKIEGVSLVLRFYNEKAELVKTDIDRATARFVPPGRSPERRVLVPSEDGMALRHGPPIRSPHVFKIYLSLFRGESEDSVEDHIVDYP
jgi:hypothetical protein